MNYSSSKGYTAMGFILFAAFIFAIANSTFHFAKATPQQEFNALAMGEILAAVGLVLMFVGNRIEDKELKLNK